MSGKKSSMKFLSYRYFGLSPGGKLNEIEQGEFGRENPVTLMMMVAGTPSAKYALRKK